MEAEILLIQIILKIMFDAYKNFMRRIIINTLVALSFVAVIVDSCKKDTYNWKDVTPGQQVIKGPDTIKADNITAYEYLAIPHGGSDYNWKVVSGPISIVKDKEMPFKINIKGQSEVNSSAVISVTETTWGGKTGNVVTFKIDKINCYTPFKDFDQFLGTGKFKSYEIDYAPYTVNLTHTSGDTIVNDNFYSMGWQLKYTISKDEKEIISIVKNQLFEYNSETVQVSGFGTYSICDSVINLKFAITRLSGDTIDNGAGTARFVRQ